MKLARILGLLLLLPAMAAGQGVYLDHVDGLNASGGINDGSTLTFHMRLINTYDEPVAAIDNGFWFDSDGITWGSVTGEWNPAYCWAPSQGCDPPFIFDMGVFIQELGDTVGFSGINFLTGTGLPVGFDDVAYSITVGPISLNEGYCMTLDSCFVPPSHHWCWGISGVIGCVTAEWGGPYEFCGIPDWRCIYVEPDPIYLNEITERTVEIYIFEYECNIDIDDIDVQTIRINGKVPPYTEPRVEDNYIVIDVYLMRLLSAYRPIVAGGTFQFFVSFSTYSSGMQEFQGEFEIVLTDGDVTLDGKTDIDDVNFLIDYLWRGGPPCLLQEMMDVNKNGQVNAADVAALQGMVF